MGWRPSRWKTTFRAPRHRNFQLFFSGQLLSLIGTWMQMIAEQWLVYRLTGSSFKLGAVGFCAQIPVFFIAPLGGIIADRYDRRKIMIGTLLGVVNGIDHLRGRVMAVYAMMLMGMAPLGSLFAARWLIASVLP